MALPVVVGVGLFSAFAAKIFDVVFKFVGGYLTKRLAVAIGLIAVLTAMTVAFWGAVLVLLQGLTFVGPPYLQQAAGLVLPTNFPVCMAAILSAHVSRWVYEMQVKVLFYQNAGAGF